MPIHLFGHLQTNLQKLDKSKDFVQKCHMTGGAMIVVAGKLKLVWCKLEALDHNDILRNNKRNIFFNLI
jgi:hypothetical protein